LQLIDSLEESFLEAEGLTGNPGLPKNAGFALDFRSRFARRE
jgi:hypothetical protein